MTLAMMTAAVWLVCQILPCPGGFQNERTLDEVWQAHGLCTMSLVCLAASVSMIQTNLLLVTAGKAPDSFIVLDAMRLPLGILTGMGFIGAGAIVRRGASSRASRPPPRCGSPRSSAFAWAGGSWHWGWRRWRWP
jgi:hypothetical protein